MFQERYSRRWLSGEPSQHRPADEAASHVAVVAQKRRGDGRRRCGGHEQLPGTAVRTEDSEGGFEGGFGGSDRHPESWT